jgi:hypothetical protein
MYEIKVDDDPSPGVSRWNTSLAALSLCGFVSSRRVSANGIDDRGTPFFEAELASADFLVRKGEGDSTGIGVLDAREG